jgi:hypothetical protein
MKVTLFWVVVPYSLLETDRRFGGAYYPSYQGEEYIAFVSKYNISGKNCNF